MAEHENTWDKLLQIKTTGRDDSKAGHDCYPYEATPYPVLERLANHGLIRKKDVVLDYGCGKGRVDFFLSYQTKAKSIGIEYDERLYQSAVENQKTAVSKGKTDFVLARAEAYEVPLEVNRYYFFNPFSVDILREVMIKIKESHEKDGREAFLFFYYPSLEYLSYLTEANGLELHGEIPCGDLFEGNDPRERIMVYRLGN